MEGGVPGHEKQSRLTCLKDGFTAVGVTHDSSDDEPCISNVLDGRSEGGRGSTVIKRAQRLTNSWHKNEEETSRQQATKRDYGPRNSAGAATTSRDGRMT